MQFVANRIGVDWDPILTRPTFNRIPIRSSSSFAPSSEINNASIDRRCHLEPELLACIQTKFDPYYEEAKQAIMQRCRDAVSRHMAKSPPAAL